MLLLLKVTQLDFYFLLHKCPARKSWLILQMQHHTSPAEGSVAPGRSEVSPDWEGHRRRPARICMEGDINKICKVIWIVQDISTKKEDLKEGVVLAVGVSGVGLLWFRDTITVWAQEGTSSSPPLLVQKQKALHHKLRCFWEKKVQFHLKYLGRNHQKLSLSLMVLLSPSALMRGQKDCRGLSAAQQQLTEHQTHLSI